MEEFQLSRAVFKFPCSPRLNPSLESQQLRRGEKGAGSQDPGSLTAIRASTIFPFLWFSTGLEAGEEEEQATTASGCVAPCLS